MNLSFAEQVLQILAHARAYRLYEREFRPEQGGQVDSDTGNCTV